FREPVLRGGLAAATVAQHQQPLRLGMRCAARVLPPQRHAVTTQCAGVVARVEVDVRVLVPYIINAMGNQLPLASGAKIMVKGFHSLRSEGRACTVKIPQEFLLFRVARNHGITRRLVLAPQTRNVLKLCVAVGMVAPRLFLSRLSAAYFHFFLSSSACSATVR